jgi:APA family basic amino acid/polyamine antiporter
LGWNIRIKGRELPVSAMVGLAATSVIWVIILVTEAYSRWVGLGWMAGGLILYYLYRRSRRASSAESQVDWDKSG